MGIKNQEAIMDKFEEFALGQYLSDWPEEASFSDIIKMLHSGDEEILQKITPWDVVEGCYHIQLAHHIKVTVSSLRRSFK